MLHTKRINQPKRLMTLRGVVLENSRGTQTDANCYLQLKTDKEQIRVIYHSEFPPTANFHGADLGFELRKGDHIETFAEVIDGKTVSICSGVDYYIRRIDS